MNLSRSIFLICVSILYFSNIGHTQNSSSATSDNSTPTWVEMMKDQSVNFYDVQKEANKYFETHPTGKGSGWKQYKRWEYFTEQRVFPTGERINHAQIWNEITKFKIKYPKENRATRNEWTTLGPSTSANVTGHWSPGIGRINVIAREPGNPQTLYIGSPSGGLWKTSDEGANWLPLTDDQPVLGVSAIAIDPTNTDIIYIGTGDKDASDNYSIGVLKSTDGGTTWEITGMDWTIYQNRSIAKLLINPNNPNILYAATTVGLFRTDDGGDSWSNLLSGDIDDLEFKPGNSNTIYATTTRFYKSVDGGDNFTETTGLPNGSRVQIAISNDNPDYVYFFSSESGIYRSVNSGNSFTFRSSQPNQGSQSWYDLAFAVSHENAEEVHVGEINTWKSSNGALSWIRTTDWIWGNPYGYTHCDIHEMVFFEGTLYIGSDGLISKTTDGASTFTNLTEGLSIRQFYKIGTSKNDPYKILGGSQDNGTSVYSTDYWHEWLGADGMECVVDYTNSNVVYGTSQFGHFYKSNTGGNSGSASLTQPGGGNWVTPFVIHPTEHNTLFVGNYEVRKTEDGMNNWTTISSLNLGNLNNLAISESNPDYLYTSRSSTIYRTNNGGETWGNVSNGLPNLHISYIAIHPENPEILAVSLSGYDEGEKVYISYDAGSSWANYSSNLPNIPANCVVFGCGLLNPLYIGMDVGVYYIDEDLSEWDSYMDDLPNVIVNELEINFDAQLIRAGTYGRGLWEANILIYTPSAAFEADQTTIPIDCNVSFTNLSQGPPETNEWTFEGGTPSTSTEQNPTDILYNNEGTYDVQLIVTNSLGVDTLLKEDYITVSSTLLPSIDFTANNTMVCSNQEVEFFDQTLFCPDSWEWSFSPETVVFIDGTNANSQNPKVTFELGVYSVTLTTSNAVGSNTLTKTDFIYSGGSALPYIEDFEVGNLADNGWTIENPDESVTWEITTVTGSTPGDKAPWMNIINYQQFGKRDRMISHAIDFTGFTNLALTFDHAYAQRYYQKDSLIVYISDDCGENWTRIFANGPDGTGIFATSPTTDSSFAPKSSEDWCGEGWGSSCNLIDISSWDNTPNIKIMFESYAIFGNNLYIDNILISNNVGISEISVDNFQVDIIPNPSSGIFNISVKDVTGTISMKIMNSQGQLVFSEINEDVNGYLNKKIDLSSQAKGIYFVNVNTEEGSEVRKILIK